LKLNKKVDKIFANKRLDVQLPLAK